MRIFLLSLVILISGACGKIWQQKKAKDQVEILSPSAITEWSGRSDLIEAKWSIKSQP